MVKFTLRDVCGSHSMRMDMNGDEGMDALFSVISEYYGGEGCCLRRGYDLMIGDGHVGTTICDGDVLDIIPGWAVR